MAGRIEDLMQTQKRSALGECRAIGILESATSIKFALRPACAKESGIPVHSSDFCDPGASPSFFSLDFLALSHRASTAFRAILLRCSDVSFAARIFPPLEPPNFPKATACGFFFLLMSPRRYSARCGQIKTNQLLTYT